MLSVLFKELEDNCWWDKRKSCKRYLVRSNYANDLDVREAESPIRRNNIAVPAGTIEANNVDLTLI